MYQISKDLFCKLINYFVLSELFEPEQLEQTRQEITAEIRDKARRVFNRLNYGKALSAATPEEQQEAFQTYLAKKDLL